jgi:hypothetical protein
MSILENKTNENPRKVLEKSGSVYITASKNDSYAATSPIPQSDYQYTWVTSSVLSDKRVFLNSGYLTSSNWLEGNQVLSGSRIIEDINGDTTGLPKAIKKPSSNLRLPDGEDGDYGPYSSPNQWLADDSLSTKIEEYLVSPLDLQQDGGSDNLRSRESVPLMNSLYLYGLNGADGWATRKNIRNGDHPVTRYYKRKSRITVMDEPRTITTTDGRQVKEKRNPNQTEYHEPYINAAHLPVKHKFDQITDDIAGRIDTVTLKYTLSNNTQFFSNKALNRRLDADTEETNFYDTISQQYLDDAVSMTPVVNFRSLEYSQVIWPRAENMFLSKIRDRPDFYFPWKDKRSERNVDNYVNAMGETIDEASIWVLDARDNFATTPIAGTGAVAQNRTGELQSDQSVLKENQKSHVQYFYRTEESASYGIVYAGETKFEAGEQAGVQPFEENHAKFVNKLRNSAKEYSLIPEFRISEHIPFYVDERAGNFLEENKNLFSVTGAVNSELSDTDFYRVFNTTDLMSEDFVKIKADHENIASPTRLKLKASAFLTFLPYEGLYPAQRTVQLATLFSESYGDNIIYSGSTSLTTPAEYAKFKLINQVFYAPGLMYNTIKSGIAVDFPVLTGSTADDVVSSDYGGGPFSLTNRYSQFNYRYIYMFDAPVTGLGGADSWYKVPFEALLDPESHILGKQLRDMDPSPFGVLYPSSGETPAAYAALTTPKTISYKLAVNNFLASVPDFFLKGRNFSNIVSADDKDPNYFNFDLNKEYRARVYLRGCDNFDEVSAWSQAYEDGYNILVGRTGTSTSTDSEDYAIYVAAALAISGSRKYSKPNFSMYDRPNFNYADLAESYNDNLYLGSFTIYSASGSYHHGGSAFGGNKYASPLFVTIGDVGVLAGDPDQPKSFFPYNLATYDTNTPPYYDGYAYVDLIYKPSLSDGTLSQEDKKVRVSLDTVLSNITSSFYRYSTNALVDYLSNEVYRPDEIANAQWAITGSSFSGSFFRSSKANMQIDASLNIFGRIKNKLVEYDDNSDVLLVREDPTAGDRLVIYPKFETPIYDYSEVEYEVPNSGAYSVGAGMWHQYGDDLTDSNGLFMQVLDAPSELVRIPTTGSEAAYPFSIDNSLTASLADAIGLPKEPVRLGETASKKTVSEAIVLVPFVEQRGNKRFFSIDEDQYELALSGDRLAPKNLRQTLRAMDKYVIPPQFNFKLYDGQNGRERIEPMLMYFLEFSYDFDREDLKRIWHNLPPKISAGLVEKELEIGQELTDNELLSDYHENLKWLVFKVKQKAEKNYFKKTLDSRDDERFKFDFKGNGIFSEPEYSYNWPYDYFSLVEMAKIQADVLIETSEEATRRRNLQNNPELVRMPTSVREDVDIRENIRPPDTAPTTQQAQATSTIQSTQGIRDFLNNED